jgi:thymidylate synthase
VQWRAWQGTKCVVDQLTNLIANLKADPYSRRHIVTAWQPAELDQMCLPPCHILFQCYVSNGHLDLRVDMRSVDLFLGMPFDVASYAVLLSMLAQEVGLESRYLVFQLGDTHIYLNHVDQVQEMLLRKPKKLPTLKLAKKSMFDLTMDDITLEGYESWPAITAEMSV